MREKLGDEVRWDDVDGVVDLKKDWKEVMVSWRITLVQSVTCTHIALLLEWCCVSYQLAAYPILAPIYIAEYSYKSEDKATPRRITVVMDGSQEVGG